MPSRDPDADIGRAERNRRNRGGNRAVRSESGAASDFRGTRISPFRISGFRVIMTSTLGCPPDLPAGRASRSESTSAITPPEKRESRKSSASFFRAACCPRCVGVPQRFRLSVSISSPEMESRGGLAFFRAFEGTEVPISCAALVQVPHRDDIRSRGPLGSRSRTLSSAGGLALRTGRERSLPTSAVRRASACFSR